MRFGHAIARRVPATFADGITTAALGKPYLERALAQHAAYCSALVAAGVDVALLEPDERYPDSPFVEDTAVVACGRALLTRPGAASRRGEVGAVRDALARFFGRIETIAEPGTLDGGDVCETEETVYVGISERTNRSGAEQLAAWLAAAGKRTVAVDMSEIEGLLHLKSGLAYLGEGIFLATAALAARVDLPGEIIVPRASEEYAANAVRVNDGVLVPEGYPALREAIEARGLRTVALDVSEYRKMDGGLSCLSIRF